MPKISQEDFAKMLYDQMPDHLKEMLGITTSKSKKTYIEVTKITPKELSKFVENRELINVLESILKGLVENITDFKRNDSEWWNDVKTKYNLNDEDDYRVNRENMTIERIVTIEEVK